jgi:hypothetical protein
MAGMVFVYTMYIIPDLGCCWSGREGEVYNGS